MLSDGWVSFLASFDQPDIKLWHNIVNNFHELHGDQLDAAYWIMAHAECDQATVFGFLTGFIGYGDLQSVLRDAQRNRTALAAAAQPMVSVIECWNSGFYKSHSIAYDEDETPSDYIGSGEQLNDWLAALTEEFGIDLPFVERTDFDPFIPVDDMSRSKPSVFEICDGVPLQLAYPHDWPKGVTPPQ